MVADPILFRDLAYVFVAAVLGGGLAWLARQPLILGYVAGGLLVSPLTLVEDLAVVVLVVLIPAIGGLHGGDILALGKALATAAAILVPFFFLAGRILPRLLTLVAKTRNDELFLLVALAVALGAAALTQAAGLSLALGAFLAGLLINESDYAHETLARLLPLRDAFVALFFVTVGALIDLRTIATSLPLLATLVGLIVLGKWVIWTAVALLFGQPLLTALLVGVGLTQIGEFSFILVQVARQAGHVEIGRARVGKAGAERGSAGREERRQPQPG